MFDENIFVYICEPCDSAAFAVNEEWLLSLILFTSCVCCCTVLLVYETQTNKQDDSSWSPFHCGGVSGRVAGMVACPALPCPTVQARVGQAKAHKPYLFPHGRDTMITVREGGRQPRGLWFLKLFVCVFRFISLPVFLSVLGIARVSQVFSFRFTFS